ncbi:ribbon-helix-helix protein, CopG family [Rhodopseudomonas sp.]|uniref:ribbon-helix-helix protein, CopG family n=1 Tax=Rhodopseudomonas sp. TaxID=1078 RepID=UPI0039E2608D
MNTNRRTIDLDPATDERLRRLAAQRGQTKADVIAEALALLDRTPQLQRWDDLFLSGARRSDDFMNDREQPAGEKRASLCQ